jgi:MFS superfamily sulfate permease-like transporter
MKSPSPSFRHVSRNRVVNERSVLLDPSGSQSSHIPPGIPKYLLAGSRQDNTDVDSIDYQHSNSTPSEYSVEYAQPDAQGDYPANLVTKIENLPWNELLPYYFPILSWINQYNFSFFVGDLIGGLTLVFFQLPLCLSYATTLAHVPVISGLFSLGVSPLIYMVFGSVPQMVVGPEAPISLVVGQAVEPLLHHSKKHNLDPLEYVVAITFVSGATLLGFGLGRFGFLDNVLSASLLKGFICGVGIVMVINSSITALGLEDLLKQISQDPSEMDIHSPFDKVRFLFNFYPRYNPLSFKVSIIGFIIIMTIRTAKKIAMKKPGRYQNAVYIPEILLVVGISTVLCSVNRWDQQDLKIIGKIKNDGDLVIYNPFSPRILPLIKALYIPGFLCAMLGFFESTTASKTLGSTYNLPISSNRELVALGCINICGSILGALPAFGGYGRSKINAISAKTTFSGGIMGIITLLTVCYLLDYLYFVPECMLSVVSAVIGISLIEEAPFELRFHWKSRGWSELITFFVTVTTTIFFSMEAGIAVGIIYLLIRVIRNSAKSRIQILGRQPGTNTFLNADVNIFSDEKEKSFFVDEYSTKLNTTLLEEIEGCLIIKIPEPLTFTNCCDLRARLRRVEIYGSTKAHPAQRRCRSEAMTQYIIFDLNGMTELDSSAAQILMDIVNGYRKRGIRSFFVRMCKNKSLRTRLRNIGMVDVLLQDLHDMNYFSTNSGSNERDLIESTANPYFSHIQDALLVIENYERGGSSRHISEIEP